jgi:hypothetical protein
MSINSKEYDLNSYTQPKSSSPYLYSKEGDFFKTINAKSSGQSISTQEKNLRDLNKSNPNLSFQNNFYFFKKIIFNNNLNNPLLNSMVYNNTNLG